QVYIDQSAALAKASRLTSTPCPSRRTQVEQQPAAAKASKSGKAPGVYFSWDYDKYVVLMRHASIIRLYEIINKGETKQGKWMAVVEAMIQEDPVAYSGVTYINADRNVANLVKAWEQTRALWERRTGEDKEETRLDALVAAYARDRTRYEMESAEEKENRRAELEKDMLIAACLRKDATETLSKKRVLKDMDWNTADGQDEGSVPRKRGKPAEEARSSLKVIADMLRTDKKQAEGMLEVAQESEDRKRKALELKECELEVREMEVKNMRDMMMTMFKELMDIEKKNL
ncbi:hypothetical protein M427DRAFT_494965, partial [Gonapodya prolifera JEL478]